ncbi:hypothetical protein BGZ97_009640, partial [Linnemannia gamsii]
MRHDWPRSLLIRLFHDLRSAPRHPDLIVKYQEEKDIDFGEVSFSPSAKKDIGDLCRCAMWTKRALDELVTKLEGVEELILLFFQIIDRRFSVYQMRRYGTICVASLLGEFDIIVCLDDLLAKFEDHVHDWLLFSCAFDTML